MKVLTLEAGMTNLSRNIRRVDSELVEARARYKKAIADHDTAVYANTAAIEKLLKEVNEQRLAYHQAMWLQMDAATVGSMLEGHSHQGTALIDTVDPSPIAVEGSYVGFRWGFPETTDGQAQAQAFSDRYLADYQEPVIDTRVLSTGGVFAEAVLGRANSAEKLDITRFWDWDENTIPILPTAIDKLRSSRHAHRAEVRAGQIGDPAVNISSLPDAPDGLSHALGDVIGASMFRDMTGSSTITELLTDAQAKAAAGADNAMEIAHENISAYLDHMEVALPELVKFVGPGKLNPSKLGALSNALGAAGGGKAAGATGAAGAAAKGTGGINAAALLRTAGKAGVLL